MKLLHWKASKPATAGDSRTTRSDEQGVPAIGGPVRVAWRELTLTRAHELAALSEWVGPHTQGNDKDLAIALLEHVEAARSAACGDPPNRRRWFRIFRTGPLIERAESNLQAAEAHLLALAPDWFLLGQMPSLLNHVQRHLPRTDARRQEFERIAQMLGIKDPDHPLIPKEKDSSRADKKAKEAIVRDKRREIVNIVRGAGSAALREQLRLRSFKIVVVGATGVLFVLAIGVAITGWRSPTLIPLCFAPEDAGIVTVVCPTTQSAPFIPVGDPAQPDVPMKDIDDVVASTAKPGDLVVVELVGLTAAAIATAAAIRGIRGSSERAGPLDLPVALAVLKLPTGAITAFLGLLLMRGQFVPGLTALDTPAQILAWALVFGYAQQLFTRFVDQQGQTVLDNVRGADRPEPTAPAA